MPLIEKSTYKAPALFKNAHIQTIFPALFRKVEGVAYSRERIFTDDADFIDLDWSKIGSKKLLVVFHGLESSTDAGYMHGIIKAANKNGYDAVGVNFRGCSGEINKLISSYHSGATADADFIFNHIKKVADYRFYYLAGFSLGGNMLLKYVGERGKNIDPAIKAAAAVSVPIDLGDCAEKMRHFSNKIYMQRFLRFLRAKIKTKIDSGFKELDYTKISAARSFREFDDLYTAPVHGFKDAEDYYAKCSSKQFLSQISIPTLLINAQDDPFLTKACLPGETARKSEHFFLDAPENGGHVGFIAFNEEKEYWHEKRIFSFFSGIS